MSTFVLTWNPNRYAWDEYDEEVLRSAEGESVLGDWSTGNRISGIHRDDRAVLFRQGAERGIVATGRFTGETSRDRHWSGDGGEANYAVVLWDRLVDPEDRVPVETLKAEVPGVPWDSLYASGVKVDSTSEGRLWTLCETHLGAGMFRAPEEPAPGETFAEGAVTRVEVNRYERDPRARQRCLEAHGRRCSVCDFDFEERYGSLGEGFIHVHHVRELSQLGPDYQIDPVKDLRPVCANCHSMLHQKRPALTVAQLRRRLRTT